MGVRSFKSGDRVALSATFLRSICVDAAKGWPTTLDRGKGTIIGPSPEIDSIIYVIWDDDETNGVARGINVNNLTHVRLIYNDSMRAEHRIPDPKPHHDLFGRLQEWETR